MTHLGYKDEMDDLNLPPNIPVDDEYFRTREIDDDVNSAWSIASSRFNFKWEHGRLYHDYGSGHPFPYDEISHDNEKILHAMMGCLLDNEFYVAPLQGSLLRNVLDVGTGLGFWALDMAEKYPDCHIIGLDKTPQPTSVIPNYEFITTDINSEWIFDKPDQKFDFIHIRSLFASLSDNDWPPLYKQCFEYLEPGGWIEQIEVEIEAHCDDGTAKKNSDIVRLAELTRKMSATFGTDFRISETMKERIEDAGFVEVREAKHKLPLGWWSADPKYKDIGRFYERFYKTGLQGWLMHILTKKMGYEPWQVNEECMKAFREIDSREHHYYFNLVIVIGRKPSIPA